MIADGFQDNSSLSTNMILLLALASLLLFLHCRLKIQNSFNKSAPVSISATCICTSLCVITSQSLTIPIPMLFHLGRGESNIIIYVVLIDWLDCHVNSKLMIDWLVCQVNGLVQPSNVTKLTPALTMWCMHFHTGPVKYCTCKEISGKKIQK